MNKSKIQIIYFKEKEIPVLKIEDQYYLTIDEISLIIGKSKNTVSKILLKLKQEGIKIGLFLSEIGTNSEALLPSLLPKSQYLRKKYYNLQEFEIIGNRINKNLTYDFLMTIKEENIDSFTETSIIKFNSDDISLDVKISPEEQTVWLNQNQIAILYDTTQQNVSLHINNIFQDNELDKNSVHKEYLYTGIDGINSVFKEGELERNTSMQKMHKSQNSSSPNYRPPVYYNLDVVISVRYRVKPRNGIIFRRWAISMGNSVKKKLRRGEIIHG